MTDQLSQHILVTGGAGFIGIPLVKELLKKGHEVAIFDKFVFPERHALLPKNPALQIFENDLNDYAKVQETIEKFKPNTIFHLAAIHYIPLCNEFPSDALNVNVIGTQNLLTAIKNLKINQFIYASSAAVYMPTGKALKEEDFHQPMDVYGISKVSAEMLVRLHHEMTGQSCILARFFNTFGPNETNPHVIPDILAQIQTGTHKIKLGKIDSQRDFIYVNDLVSALMLLMEKDGINFETFNIGSGRAISIKEVVETIGLLLKVNIEIEIVEDRKRKMDAPILLANTDKLKGFTGWHPEYDFASGMKAILSQGTKSNS
jgi:UDP-glucose 4-epimerase